MSPREPTRAPRLKAYKQANITAFHKFYRIHSWAVYGDSRLDPDGVDRDYPANLSDIDLGAATREALLASRFIPPDHPDWRRVGEFLNIENHRLLQERLMVRAGVKTTGALYRGVGEVDLTLQDGTITLVAGKYEGRGGFGPIRGMEPTRLPETVSDEELGATIRYLIGISRKPWTRP